MIFSLKAVKTVILFGFNLRLGERYMPKFLDAPSWYNSDGYLVRDEGYTYYHHIRIRFTPLGGLQVYRYSNSAWSQTTIQEDYVTVYLMIPGPVNQEVADFNTLFHTLRYIADNFPDHITVYPGHDYGDVPAATLGELKKSNLFLRCTTIERFRRAYRMMN